MHQGDGESTKDSQAAEDFRSGRSTRRDLDRKRQLRPPRLERDLSGTPAFKDLTEAGGALVPHFDALLADFFLALFKFNLVWRKPGDVRRAAGLNRTILDEILPSPAFEALKNRTLLEEDKAAIAAIVLESARSK